MAFPKEDKRLNLSHSVFGKSTPGLPLVSAPSRQQDAGSFSFTVFNGVRFAVLLEFNIVFLTAASLSLLVVRVRLLS